MIIRFALGLLAAFTLGLLAFPQPAAAAYPCPNGAGPGEVQVGVSGGSGVAPVPMCERVGGSGGGGGGAGGGGGVVYNAQGSVAWHTDADDVWMDGNWTRPGPAEREALAACNREMGGGCTSIGEWNNSSTTIFRDSQGILYSGWEGQGGAERKQALAECSAKQVLPCEILHSFSAAKDHYRPKASARKLYASAAWIFGEGFDWRLYIASGHRSVDAANKSALAACAAATGGAKCTIAVGVGNGVIQPYLTGGSGSAVVERTNKRAGQTVLVDCKRRKKKCTLQRSYDSRVSGNFVHDFNETGAKK